MWNSCRALRILVIVPSAEARVLKMKQTTKVRSFVRAIAVVTRCWLLYFLHTHRHQNSGVVGCLKNFSNVCIHFSPVSVAFSVKSLVFAKCNVEISPRICAVCCVVRSCASRYHTPEDYFSVQTSNLGAITSVRAASSCDMISFDLDLSLSLLLASFLWIFWFLILLILFFCLSLFLASFLWIFWFLILLILFFCPDFIHK